jgi:seryl-tRNA synthetase
VVVKEWGTFKKQEQHRYNHVDLVKLLDIADLENGSVVAGGRGYYLKGAGVLLNQALINCALQHGYKRGSEPIQTPFFMRKSIMAECAQLKEFDEALYHVCLPCFVRLLSQELLICFFWMCGHILAGRLCPTRIVAQCMLGDLSAICGVFLKHVPHEPHFPMHCLPVSWSQ